MASDWTRLYNTLILIDTRGESSIIMGDCLRFVKQKMAEEQQETSATESGES